MDSALRLQSELSSFLGLPLSAEASRRRAGGAGVCLGQSMVTSKKSRIRVHNATVKEVKRSVACLPPPTKDPAIRIQIAPLRVRGLKHEA